MAEPAEEPRLDEEEDGGGPVKSFLEHLEDLRWVLIKCMTAIMLGMVVCLLGVNQVVAILKWPLERARRLPVSSSQRVSLYLGEHRLATFGTKTNRLGGLDLGKDRAVALELVPVTVGTNELLSIQKAANPAAKSETPGQGPSLIFLDPAAPFVSSLHIAFFGGLLLASPFVFYFIGLFVVPALKIKEKHVFLRAFGIGVGLFLTGVCFCYFGLMPLALRASEAYSLWMGVEMPEWRAETYFSFVTKFMLGMGLGFEMPVILLALVRVGILDYKKLASFRRYMIIVNLILGAVLTTPEVLTQVMMFVPMQALYEISVWIAYYWERKEKKRLERQTAQNLQS